MKKAQREAFQSLNPQQQKLALLILENLKKPKPEAIRHVLLAAGYSKDTADNGNMNIIKSKNMSKALEPIADQFEKLRIEAIKEISKRKLKSSSAESLVRMADLAHKNERLARGESTENVICLNLNI